MSNNFLFEILNSINYSKEDLSDREEFEKNYNPYIINKFVAGSMDTIFFAAEISKYSSLPKKMQYDFYRNVIRAKKRFAKWIKGSEDTDIESIASYFKCSKKEAKNYRILLNEKELQRIRNATLKGGKI